jgi:hypothetical protein
VRPWVIQEALAAGQRRRRTHAAGRSWYSANLARPPTDANFEELIQLASNKQAD